MDEPVKMPCCICGVEDDDQLCVVYASGSGIMPYCGQCIETLGHSPVYDLPRSCISCHYTMSPIHAGLFPLVAGLYVMQCCSRACVADIRASVPADAITMCANRDCGSQLVNETRCPDCDMSYCGPECLAAHAPQHMLRCRLRVAFDTLMVSVKATMSMYGASWSTAPDMLALCERLELPVTTHALGKEISIQGPQQCVVCDQPVVGTKHIGTMHDGTCILMCDGCLTSHGWPIISCYRCGWNVRPIEALLFGGCIHPDGLDMRFYQTYCSRYCVEETLVELGADALTCDVCSKKVGTTHPCVDCGSTYYCGVACRNAHAEHEFPCRLAMAYNVVMNVIREISHELGVTHGPEWIDSGLYKRLTQR
jgi:hypothetical protein